MKILDDNINKDLIKREKVHLRPTDMSEIYKEPFQADMYTLVKGDSDDYLGYHNHTKHDHVQLDFESTKALEDLCLLLYLHNKLQKGNKGA